MARRGSEPGHELRNTKYILERKVRRAKVFAPLTKPREVSLNVFLVKANSIIKINKKKI